MNSFNEQVVTWAKKIVDSRPKNQDLVIEEFLDWIINEVGEEEEEEEEIDDDFIIHQAKVKQESPKKYQNEFSQKRDL